MPIEKLNDLCEVDLISRALTRSRQRIKFKNAESLWNLVSSWNTKESVNRLNSHPQVYARMLQTTLQHAEHIHTQCLEIATICESLVTERSPSPYAFSLLVADAVIIFERTEPLLVELQIQRQQSINEVDIQLARDKKIKGYVASTQSPIQKFLFVLCHPMAKFSEPKNETEPTEKERKLGELTDEETVDVLESMSRDVERLILYWQNVQSQANKLSQEAKNPSFQSDIHRLGRVKDIFMRVAMYKEEIKKVEKA